MKHIGIYILMICLLFSIGGCTMSEETSEEGGYRIFYLNKNITKITDKPYEMKASSDDTKGMIDELIEQMQIDSGDVEYKKLFTKDMQVEKVVLEGNLLTLYFNESYLAMDKVQEALTRAAIVRTLTQIQGVECLSFYVAGTPLLDDNGDPVGVMSNDSFIENPGEQINAIQTSTLVLYFANEDGNGLVQETQEVHYSSNVSMEKLIVEKLLEGPKTDDVQSAIPKGTKLISVSVLDGVCYVNLDNAFMNQNYSIEEPIVIYSIVNSLSELSTINKVQISVNGDTKGVYRDSFAMDKLYERNLDYMKDIENTERAVEEKEIKGEVSIVE